MLSPKTRPLAAFTLPALAGTALVALSAQVAIADDFITLFGQRYLVQRFDYSEQVQFPNRNFPNDPPTPFIESEGVTWAGNNRLLMSADDIVDVAPGNPDNWVVEVNVLTDESGRVTGLSYARAIVVIDTPVARFDLNPSGVTINTAPAGAAGGFGSGGNIIVCGGDGFLYGFSYQAPTLGQQLPLPVNSNCVITDPGNCAISMTQRNVNAEDAAYVPGGGTGGSAAFFAINQDTSAVERYDPVTGSFLGSFGVGSSSPGSPVGLVPKGITYISDNPGLPASLRHPAGIILVSFDRGFPGLQALTVTGQPLGLELLTVDGTAGGTSRLELSGCPLPLHIESLTSDPGTGRLFLVNQGALTICNYMYILTPEVQVPACPADFNGDGITNPDDLADFIGAFFVVPSAPGSDFNADGTTDPDDLADFIGAFFASPC